MEPETASAQADGKSCGRNAYHTCPLFVRVPDAAGPKNYRLRRRLGRACVVSYRQVWFLVTIVFGLG